MKKQILTFFLMFILCLIPASADDFWDSYTGLDRAWDGQKSITNKEFEDVVNALEQNKQKKEAKQKKKKIKKISGGGTSLHKELSPEKDIKELEVLTKTKAEEHLLNIPIDIVLDDTVLEKGYYKVIAEKDKNSKIIFKFYQSQFYKGQIKAIETEDDNDEDSIDFVKLIPFNEQYVKIIYGSLDFNAQTFVRIQE